MKPPSFLLGLGLAVLLSIFTACRSRAFQIIPETPQDILQDPGKHRTPFDELLHEYNGYRAEASWIDLRPLMELRVENAYYEPGASRRGLAGYLGTEVARYEILRQKGLALLSVRSMPNRPARDLPVSELISQPAAHFAYYRLFYEIVFTRKNDEHGSVLLGASSTEELRQLAAHIAEPGTVCETRSPHCTIFPEACSVSVEMKIWVNGKLQELPWRSTLASVAPVGRGFALQRLYKGRLAAVKLPAHDPAGTAASSELALPLLPGDRIEWK
jgi:hypothetical protein